MGTFKTVCEAAYNRGRLILYRFGNLVRLIIRGGLRLLFRTLRYNGINNFRKRDLETYGKHILLPL